MESINDRVGKIIVGNVNGAFDLSRMRGNGEKLITEKNMIVGNTSIKKRERERELYNFNLPILV